ncbi:MAG: lysophospholipid acyltransferase family protein [Bryobacteraceae bacterium]|nr:lysophospholipid acyltransferase family protein [Bryobacteraceae bacterium]
MKQRSSFRNWAECLVARAVVGTLASLPRDASLRLALRIARLLDRAAPRLRRAGRENLLRAGYANADELIDGNFVSLGRLLHSFAHLPSLHQGNIGEWIRYEGFEHYEEAKRRGKGVLFATGHLGNWELSAYAHALLTEPMSFVVRPLDNPLLDAFVAKRRAGSGNRVIEKKDFARGLIRALRANEAVGILVDQNAMANEGIFVDFFGTPACTSPVFAKIAARSGATVLPGFAVWRQEGFVLKFYAPVPMTGDEVADTQAVQAAVERAVREYPSQWLWIHRRWKTRP